MRELRFLIDAQLPPGLAAFLESRGYEARAARDAGLRDADDKTIWNFAQRGGWTVVTKDEDFVQGSKQRAASVQIVWLRIGNSTKRVLLDWFAPLLKNTIRELKKGQRVVELRR